MSFVLIQSPWPPIFSVWPEPDHNSHRTSSIIFESLLYQLLLFLSFIRIYFLCRIYDLSFEFLNRPFRFEYIRRRKIRSIRVRRQRKELLHIQTESASVRGRACLKVNSYSATALKRIIRKRDKLRERASIETHGKNIAASMEIASKLLKLIFSR